MSAAFLARVTDARLVLDRADELATHSARTDGIERTYLTAEHRAVNALAAKWMRQAGMRTWQDAAGNACGRLEGLRPGLPALLLGSHLDTVPDAGRYDGILGVLAAIAVVTRLREGELPFAVEVIAFGDEEGTRFGTTLLGSRAVAGTWQPEWADLTDPHGVTLREAARSFGLDVDDIGSAARRAEDLVGYLEVHIEQGPKLESAQQALGVVTGIAAARRLSVTIEGEARHCATPFGSRHDALVGASEAILAIEDIARARGSYATVGALRVEPGAVNVIPGLVEFSLDLRDETAEARDATLAEILERITALAADRGLAVRAEHTHVAPAVHCAPRLRDVVRAGIRATGERDPLELFSVAGHDAMAIAARTDVAMFFVRCAGGVSHHPDEAVTEADVAAAVDALHAAVLVLAEGGAGGGAGPAAAAVEPAEAAGAAAAAGTVGAAESGQRVLP
ncbi:allantoate amidohydrolase [Planctomonas psychrotolerans]|uniref:allantoate amidohydrolase n=1 Tax=Planctomonas psychrotolerans TaxID=2528712 RepID=UPI00123B1B0A|nr:allantoate amidohydrolase [Planctomonas psychrotolerans]